MRQLVSRILLILSIITFALAVPTLVREIRQERLDVVGVPEDAIPVSDWGKYSADEAWRRRGPSSASGSAPSESGDSTAANHELPLDFPPSSPQMGTSGVQHASPSSPEIKRPSGEDYLSSGSSYPSDRDRGSVASEDYIGSNEDGPGSSKEGYSSSGSNMHEESGSTQSFSTTNIPGISKSHSTSNIPAEVGPGTSKIKNPSILNMPPVELVPVPRPMAMPKGPDNPLNWGGSWSTTSSDSEKGFPRKFTSFLGKLLKLACC